MDKNDKVSEVTEIKGIVTIKDFHVEEVAYRLLRNQGTTRSSVIREERISSIGRTYVTTLYGGNSYRYQTWNREYLLEKVDFGEKALLFRTKEELEKYVEKCEISKWLGRMDINMIEKYSYEKLRKVKEILES